MKSILRFVVLGVGVSIAFGLLHDAFSVYVCEPYLRDFHPYTGLTGFGLVVYWGVMATWWVGAIGGLLLGLCATLGSRPQLEPPAISRFLLIGSAVLLAVSIGSWFGIYRFAERARAEVTRRYGAEEFEHRRRLVSTASMHAISYAGSATLILAAGVTLIMRRRRTRASPEPTS